MIEVLRTSNGYLIRSNEHGHCGTLLPSDAIVIEGDRGEEIERRIGKAVTDLVAKDKSPGGGFVVHPEMLEKNK